MCETTGIWRLCTAAMVFLAISIRNVKAPFDFGSSSDVSSSPDKSQNGPGNPQTTIPTINVHHDEDKAGGPLMKKGGKSLNLVALANAGKQNAVSNQAAKQEKVAKAAEKDPKVPPTADPSNQGGGLKKVGAMNFKDLLKVPSEKPGAAAKKQDNQQGKKPSNQQGKVPPKFGFGTSDYSASDASSSVSQKDANLKGKAIENPEDKKGPPKGGNKFFVGSGSYSVSIFISSDLPTVPGAPSTDLDDTGNAIVKVAASMIADCAGEVADIVDQKPEMERLACKECLMKKNGGSATFNLPIGLFETFHDSVEAFLDANKAVKRGRLWKKFRKQDEGVLRWALKESLKHLPPKALHVVAGKVAPLCVVCAAPVSEAAHKETNVLVKIFLDCIKKNNDGSTKVDDLPEDFFKKFVHAVEEKANGDQAHSKKHSWLTVLAAGADFRAFVEMAITRVDKDFIKEDIEFCPNPGKGGQLLHDDVQKIISGGGDSKKAIPFTELFSKDYDRVDEEPLGDAKNIFGVAYLVKETEPAENTKAREVVMKVTRLGADPQEFPNHEALFNHPFKVDHKFVPEIVTKKKASIKADFEFYVMEYLGPTFFNLLQPGEKLKDYVLSFAETLFAVGRMYLVLKMIHSANYVHRDAHYNNWMFSRKNQHTLVLIDYGKSRHLSKYDYFHVSTDLYKWAHHALVLCKEAKIDDYPEEAKQTFANVKATLEEIELELKKFMWQHPATNRIIPYDTFYPKGYDEYATSDLLKKVDDLVDSILQTKTKRGINDKAPLTTWKPEVKENDKDKQAESSSSPKDALKMPAASAAGKPSKTSMSLSANALHKLATSHHESELFLSCQEKKGISAKDAPSLGASEPAPTADLKGTDPQATSKKSSSASYHTVKTGKTDETDDDFPELPEC